MPLSQREQDWIEQFFEALDGREKKLSAWAQGFLSDQAERWEKYGKDMFLSPKQWAVMKRAAEDIGYDGPSATGATSSDDDDSEIPF